MADWGYWAFSGLLVIVGGFQVWLLWWTLGAIRRQASHMERQTGVLERSVAAAESSAEAAKSSIEMFISKERARLRIEMNDAFDPLSGGMSSVSYMVRLHGSTDAFIVDAWACAYLANSMDAGPPVLAATSIPRVLTVGAPEFIGSATIIPHPTQKEDISEVNSGQRFLCFAGFVKYKDVFDRDRETTCRYFWSTPTAFTDGNWIQCNEQDNTQT